MKLSEHEIATQSVKTIETQYRNLVDNGYLHFHNWGNEAIASMLVGVHLRLAKIEQLLENMK